MSELTQSEIASKYLLASGEGWNVCDEVCSPGPHNPAFEERHSHTSVSAVLSGTFVYRSARARVLMAPGSLLLGEREAPFSCSHEHGIGDRCVAFYFDPVFVEDVASEIPGVRRIVFNTNRIPPCHLLAPLFADIRTFVHSCAQHAGEELALRLVAAALRIVGSGRDVPVHDRDERRISQALAIIEKNLTSQLSVATLAAEVEMTRYHFLRIFHRTVGETPYRYILNRRLVLAAQRLSTRPNGVLEIALACGFGDLSEFTRHFRSRFGAPPAAYRRERSILNTRKSRINR